MPPPEHPLPGPNPKPKPPKPKPPKPRPEPLRDHVAVPEVPFPPDHFACASRCTDRCAHHGLCAPLPPPAATVHLRSSSSSRLPTPLIALSASVLAASALLLVILLVCHLLRRRRQRQSAAAPLTQHLGNAEAGTAPPLALSEGEEGDGGVHHVWYIRTVGLDERAIAAITALVYDSGKCRRVGQQLLGGDDDGCAVCLAEFRDGETLRLLPRCGHAFHRGCIDVWLRAHVNCPLCRAPVTAKPAPAATAPSSAGIDGEAAPAAAADPAGGGGAGAEEDEGGLREPAAVRRAVSMVALPRRAPWPEVSLLREPASNSGREGEMGLLKVSGVLKLSEALEMVGVGRSGRSMSFGSALLPARSGQPAATGANNADETPR